MMLYLNKISCEADPEVVADYVLALLKHDSPSEDLKPHCIKELSDFLGDETNSFVDALFDTIES